MKKIITVINFIIAIWFLFLALMCFLAGVAGLIIPNEELSGNRWILFIDLIFAPFLIYGSILFFTGKKNKYLYGLIILGVIWFQSQIYRLFFITHGRLEGVDFSNILFFGIPFIVILFNKYLDDKSTNINTGSNIVP